MTYRNGTMNRLPMTTGTMIENPERGTSGLASASQLVASTSMGEYSTFSVTSIEYIDLRIAERPVEESSKGGPDIQSIIRRSIRKDRDLLEALAKSS